jgi:hypothetical protein
MEFEDSFQAIRKDRKKAGPEMAQPFKYSAHLHPLYHIHKVRNPSLLFWANHLEFYAHALLGGPDNFSI